jgi:tetratricopeptide (TPR) repeat protein
MIIEGIQHTLFPAKTIRNIPVFLSLLLLLFSSCQNGNEKPVVEEVHADQGNMVFKDSLGHFLRKEDIQNSTGEVNYEVMDKKIIDPKAKSLHQESRALGQAGKYELAIAKLEEAIRIEPAWAYPVYDLAYIYLLKGDPDNALKFYKKTDELEPKGFFTAKTAVYTLEGERSGKFPKGTYAYYMQIEWANGADKKMEIAKTLTEKVPDFAPAWKELADLLTDKDERLKAIEQGLSKNPDAETKGILLMNKAAILNLQGKKEEAIKILGELIFSADVTTSNLELAKFTLNSIAGK